MNATFFMLATAFVDVNSVAAQAGRPQTYRFFVLALGIFLAEGLVIFHRTWGKLPADLDRVGSELNLLAYGVAVSFLMGIFLDVTVLPGFPSKRSGAFVMSVFIFFIFNLMAYGYNARFSDNFRSLSPLTNGVQNLADLRSVLKNPRQLLLLAVSWSVGLIPSVACFAAQIFWG